MRSLAFAMLISLVANVAFAAQNAAIKLSVPAEVKFGFPKVTGGESGTFMATVVITNNGDKVLPFSRHMLDFSVKNDDGSVYPEFLWGWDKPEAKVLDTLVIQPGKTHKVTAKFTFHTGLPDDGKQMVVGLKIYDTEEKAKFKVKVTNSTVSAKF